ncbi:MAG TPA: hypothetical protein VM243_00470 [Phycisphaerae bacterium]|nr:hypothetical protein [Phycisphaerae bacterium]
MSSTILAQFISPDERVGAVHEHFAERTSADGVQTVIVALIIAVVLCGLLLVVNRIQQRNQRRREAEQEKRRQELTAPRNAFLTLQQPRTRIRRT